MPPISRLRRIAEEHEAIRAVLDDIDRELDKAPANPSDAGTWILPGLARSLRDHLVKHFALEEAGGLLGDAAAYFPPWAQEAVSDLIDEHRRIEHAIGRICDEIDPYFVPSATVQECFRAELHKLVASLDRHEADENALLGKVLSPLGDHQRHAPRTSR